MNCENCNEPLTLGTYKCNLNSYDIVDGNDNVLEIWESHDIFSGDTEIGTTTTVSYCSECHLLYM